MMLLVSTVANAIPAIGLTVDNKLVYFDTDATGVIHRTVPITDLRPGEVMVGIDFHGESIHSSAIGLFGVSNTGRFYRIIEGSNSATAYQRGTVFNPPLNGNYFGVDFDPTAKSLRVVSQRDQNLRVDQTYGKTVTVDTPLAYAAGDAHEGVNPNVSAIAYTNNFMGSSRTTLYGIDHALNVVVRVGGIHGSPSPDSGLLTTVGPLGVVAGTYNGFDIAPGSNTAYAALRGAGGISRLFTINLSTGHATLVGAIAGKPLRGLTIPTLNYATGIAVTASNRLLSFDAAQPGRFYRRDWPITGLQPGEKILGMHASHWNDVIGLGSTGRLYRIDRVDAAAGQVGQGPLSVPLDGRSFGLSLDSSTRGSHQLRVVSDAEQNLRLNPEDATMASVDTPLAYAPGDVNAGANPNVVGLAYGHSPSSLPSSGGLTLYGIDSNLDVLVRVGGAGGNPSANGGELTTIGSLGVNTGSVVSFDILRREYAPAGAYALATLTVPQSGVSKLYFINLVTGKATLIGAIGGGEVVTAVAFAYAEP